MSISLESYLMRYYTIRWTWEQGYSAEKKESTPNSNIAKHLISETSGWRRRAEMIDFLKSKINEVVNNLEMKEGLV